MVESRLEREAGRAGFGRERCVLTWQPETDAGFVGSRSAERRTDGQPRNTGDSTACAAHCCAPNQQPFIDALCMIEDLADAVNFLRRAV
jgi:hypothetical protein